MKVIFKKKVKDLKKKEYFPINKEIFLNDTRFKALKESVEKFGKEEEYFEVIKGYNDEAQIVDIDINSMQE